LSIFWRFFINWTYAIHQLTFRRLCVRAGERSDNGSLDATSVAQQARNVSYYWTYAQTQKAMKTKTVILSEAKDLWQN
jgi:hypothetical protein